MSTASTAAPEVSADDAPKSAKKKKLPLIIGAVVLLVAAGGGSYWYMSHKHGATEETKVEKKEVPPIYIPLENFTVNLQPEVGDQFLQVALSLQVTGEPVAEKLKARMPEVRNRLLLLLSSKRASELTPSAGKEKLGREIMDELNKVLEPELFKKAAKLAKVAPPVAPPLVLPVTPAPAAPAATADAATPATEAVPAEATDTPADADTEAAGEAKAAAVVLPITGVLFTSFIIQ